MRIKGSGKIDTRICVICFDEFQIYSRISTVTCSTICGNINKARSKIGMKYRKSTLIDHNIAKNLRAHVETIFAHEGTEGDII